MLAIQAASTEVEEALTGAKLKTASQVIHLEVGHENSSSDDITDCTSLLKWIYADSEHTRSAAIFADAGTGKSWMMMQLQCMFSEAALNQQRCTYVPTFITIQAVSSTLLGECAATTDQEMQAKARGMLTLAAQRW